MIRFGAHKAPLQFRDGNAQQTRFGCEWFQLPIVQIGGHQKNFSCDEFDIRTVESSLKTTNDCELPERGCLAGLIEIPFSDFKQAVAYE